MEIKSSKIAYECPIFKVEEREVVVNGAQKTFWVIVRAPNVNVVAVTKDKKIVLIKEIIGKEAKECLVLPGGKVEQYNPSEKEVRKQAVAELKEEAGFKAGKIELLEINQSPWNTLEREFYHYVAWDLEDVGQKLEEGESIVVKLVSLGQAEKIIDERRMTSPEEERTLEKALEWFKKKGLL